MVKIPVGIPIFVAAAGVDNRFATLVHRYLLSAGVWLLLASGVGLFLAFHHVDPNLLPDIAELSYGRLRPVHTMTMLFGWASLALVGVALYVVAKAAWVPMHKPFTKAEYIAVRAALWLWNLGILGGAITLCLGMVNGGREYREYQWFCMLPIGAAVALIGVTVYRLMARRGVKGVYISCWFILSSCFWIAIVVVMGYFSPWQTGIADRIVDGYYIHNAVGMWFTPLAVGVTYYALPKLLNKPIYSYALGVLGFFTHIVFYTVIGTHHYLFTPIAPWLQTCAVIFSVAMIVPVFASVGNFLLTMKGEWLAIRHSYSLPFFVVGVVGYGLASLQGSFESLREVQELLHFTHYTVGHAHLAMYVFVSFLIWGAVYGLVPRATGVEPPVMLVGVHFWLALSGIAIYVVAMCLGGHVQGASMVAGEPTIESVRAVTPYHVWRFVGASMMTISHVVFFVSLWKMRPGAFSKAFAQQPPV